MRSQFTPIQVAIIALALLLGGAIGCQSQDAHSNASGSRDGSSSSGSNGKPKTIDELQVQSALLSYADELMFTVADACAQVIARTDRPKAKLLCSSWRLGTAIGAMTAATSRNANVGYVDLMTLATLQRMCLEEPLAIETLDERDRLFLHAVLSKEEARVWSLAAEVINTQQEGELREMIVAWRRDNPDRASVTQARLQQFAAVRQVPMKGSIAPGSKSSFSIFRLLMIDPMASLDPATRQIYESRLLVERLSFWAQRLPLILGWQMEMTGSRMLESPQLYDALKTSARAVDGMNDISGSAKRAVAAYEKTLELVPAERAAAIEQLDKALATQVRALTDQSSKLVADERKQTLADAEAASQRLIDRTANRMMWVVVLGAVAIACVVLLYKWLSARLSARLAASSPRTDTSRATVA